MRKELEQLVAILNTEVDKYYGLEHPSEAIQNRLKEHIKSIPDGIHGTVGMDGTNLHMHFIQGNIEFTLVLSDFESDYLYWENSNSHGILHIFDFDKIVNNPEKELGGLI